MSHLNIEQIKKLNGKPVWVVDTKDKISYWAIVSVLQSVYEDEICLISAECEQEYINHYVYGKTQFVYKHEPVMNCILYNTCQDCIHITSKESEKRKINFCQNCGRPLNNKAVEILKSRLEDIVECK